LQAFHGEKTDCFSEFDGVLAMLDEKFTTRKTKKMFQ
jgi:hypothetical protein